MPASEMVGQVTGDLALLRKHARAVRLYSSLGIYSLIPKIAKKDGLSVTAGAWISASDELKSQGNRRAHQDRQH